MQLASSRTKKALAAGALVLSGFGAGAAVAVTGSASAATDAVVRTVGRLDPTQSLRSDEELLTGATADKVEAAALAAYPNATIQRLETDSEGVYEAHLVTADGEQVTVLVDEDFDVTGTQTGGGFHGGPPPAADGSST